MRMTSQPERPKVSRRRMLQAAAIVPAAAIPSLVVASPAHADYLGNISRSNVMSRARDWYDRGIAYSFDADARAWDNDHNHLYRRDCSGFVSMAWHSATPGHSTRTLHEISHPIYWSSLLPGDIVNKAAAWPDGHTRLFEKWSTTPGAMRVYELTSDGMKMRAETYYVDALKDAGYSPLRYDKIFD
jgi:hypothetical protein